MKFSGERSESAATLGLGGIGFDLASHECVAHSEPALYRLSYVARELIEAQFGLRSVFMHYVDQLFEQHQVARVRSYTCPDEDTIETLPLQLGLNHCHRSVAKVS